MLALSSLVTADGVTVRKHSTFTASSEGDVFFSLPRFLEGDEDEDTCTISQEDIADSVDITSATKVRCRQMLDITLINVSLVFLFPLTECNQM